MSERLKSKVIIVTGAKGLIGNATRISLLKNGATVVAHETDGNIIVLFINNFDSNKAWAINKFAEDPLFTKTAYFELFQFEKICSNFFDTFDFVRIFVLIIHLVNLFNSNLEIVSSANFIFFIVI